AGVRSTVLAGRNDRRGKRACTLAAGASGGASRAVSWTVGAGDAEDHPEKRPQCGGGGLCAKAGGAAVARVEFGRTVSLRPTEKLASEICAAAGACHGPAPQRRSGQGHTAVSAIRTRKNPGRSFAAAGAGGEWLAGNRSAGQG